MTKKKPVRKKVNGWAVLIEETVGRNTGKYFLSEAVEFRSTAWYSKKKITNNHPGWKVKAVPCEISYTLR